jgi:NAD-dependent DNA ligase
MARTNEMSQMADVAAVMLESNTALRGKKICITGHLGKTRAEIAKLIEDAGGEFHDSLKWNTTHLLTNADWNANSVSGSLKGKPVSSKFEKAKKQGTRVISEAEFYAMLVEADSKGA